MIEILVDEYYFEYIKYFKAKLTNQLEENLEENADILSKRIEKDSNDKDRLIDKEYGLILENNPNICIAIDLAIIHTDRIHTNLMQIYDLKKHTHFLITPDFKHFLSSEIDIHIEKSGVKYENTTMSEDEIIQFLSENYPNVLTFINSNTKWSEFSIPKKESVDVSKFKSVEPEKGKQLKEEPTKEELLVKIAQLEKENEFLKRQNQQLMQSQQQTPNVAPIL